MPIKDPTIYPKYWKQFSKFVRVERAKNRCEFCGRGNYSVYRFNTDEQGFENAGGNLYIDKIGWSGADSYKEAKELVDEWNDWSNDGLGKWKICVLTVAHLDYAGGVCDCLARTGFKCANPKHVKALCQRCHNSMDMKARRINAEKTLTEKRDSSRPLFQQI